MSHYVRARHYSNVTGGWSTVDPLWPDESAYGYVSGRPTRWIDPTGQFWWFLFGDTIIVPRPLPRLEVWDNPNWGAPKPWPGYGGYGSVPPSVPGLGQPHTRDACFPRPSPYPEDEQDRHRRECDDLYEWYKSFCGGRGTGVPQPPTCNENTPPDVAIQRAGLWCNCCEGRKDHFNKCNGDMGHWIAMNSACSKCAECLKRARTFIGPPNIKPPPRITPPGPPVVIGPSPWIA